MNLEETEKQIQFIKNLYSDSGYNPGYFSGKEKNIFLELDDVISLIYPMIAYRQSCIDNNFVSKKEQEKDKQGISILRHALGKVIKLACERHSYLQSYKRQNEEISKL